MFLVIASLLLVSHPLCSPFRDYFDGASALKKPVVAMFLLDQSRFDRHAGNVDDDVKHLVEQRVSSSSSSGSDKRVSSSGGNRGVDFDDGKRSGSVPDANNAPIFIMGREGEGTIEKSSSVEDSRNKGLDKSSLLQPLLNSTTVSKPDSSLDDDSGDTEEGFDESSAAVPSLNVMSESEPIASSIVDSGSTANAAISAVDDSGTDDLGCDLYQGTWVYHPQGPLYTNNTCPVLTQTQNCQGNGRPDKEFENWRWKPSQCDLPRFHAKKFLELMRGKTIAFVGDSVARNQMESLVCILWQVEVPKNRGSRNMHRYHFSSTDTMIVRIWSGWLVHTTAQPFDFAPDGVDKLHLDVPDERVMQFLPKFDVVFLSYGHWFTKQSAYIVNNTIVGGQFWWPDKSRRMKVNNIKAFGISVETIITAMVTHPNYTGLTILRSYSPDHYEGGNWNTGGSCTGKTKPLAPSELVENGFTNIMHNKQITASDNAIKKATNKSKLSLMDITEVFSYRHDGHPGPYRSTDLNKITKRGPDGRPPPQDCLHWCMPGPIDTWNELLLEILRREFQGK